MHSGHSEQPGLIGKIVKKFLDMNLATKFSLMFSCIILAVLFFTILVLSNSGLQYVQDRQDSRGRQSLEYVHILIEKDQRYLDGLIEYYISSTEAQELINLSNQGLPVPKERTQELLKSARFKMYLLSVVIYNANGEPIDFVSIDSSYGPVTQSGQVPERPFDRLMDTYLEYEWEYIPSYSDYFMEMDHSSKLVLWKKVEDYNTQQPIGVVAVSVDVRKLLGSDIAAGTQQNTILLSHESEVALNRTGIPIPDELAAYLCEHAQDTPAIYQADFNGQGYNIYYILPDLHRHPLHKLCYRSEHHVFLERHLHNPLRAAPYMHLFSRDAPAHAYICNHAYKAAQQALGFHGPLLQGRLQRQGRLQVRRRYRATRTRVQQHG